MAKKKDNGGTPTPQEADMATLWERVVGFDANGDEVPDKLPLHQFQASIFEAASDIGEEGAPGTPAYDKTWPGKTVTRADIVTTYSLTAEQDNSTTGNIDLQYLLDVYEQSSDAVNVKNFIDNVFLLAEDQLFDYQTEATARARLDLIASN